ncbi:MAG: hypothetical protein ACU0AZ_03150 [Paracoccaceae bacterium]
MSRTWERYNSVTIYECDTCGQTLEIVPLSHVGYTLTVGVMALSFIIYLFVVQNQLAGFWIYAIIAGLAAVQLVVTASQYLPHHQYPLTPGAQEQQSDPIDKSLRTSIQRMSFLSGAFLPIIFGALFLGTALLLGLFHDLYFPPP